MTRKFSRARSQRVRPAVRLLRAVLALALAFLTVPFLTLSPAYAEEAGAPTDTTVVETTAPPPEPAPAPEPAAPQEPAAAPAPEPAAPEEPAAHEAAPEEPVVTEEPAATEEPAPGQSGSQESAKTVTPLAASLPDPDCTVTDFDQNKREDATGDWINGALNQTNSNYAEGDFVPQKVELGGLVPGTYTLSFTFDRTKNGKFAYDYVAGLAILGSAGASATWSSANADFAGPAPTSSPGGTYAVTVTIRFTITDASDPTATLRWTGHIASEIDYGPGTGAGSISGAPYHFSLVSTADGATTYGCDAGKRDNQLMADAVEAGVITIVKDAQPNAEDDFDFTISAPNALEGEFTLDDDPDSDLSNTTTYRVPPGLTTITELLGEGDWELKDISCTKAGTETDDSVTVSLVDDEAVTCTFINTQTSSLTVDKYWVINGDDPVLEGQEPANLELDADLTVNGTGQEWGVAGSTVAQGSTATIDETVDFGDNGWCTWAGTEHGRVTEVNDAETDFAVPHGITMERGANHATITNTVTCTGRLILLKEVTNTYGGTAGSGDFTLVASPADGGADLEIAGDLGTPLPVTADVVYTFDEKDGPSGYTWSGVTCGSDDDVASVQVPAGETRTCTFTNHDNPGSLQLVKKVEPNGTGDDTLATEWTLTATPDGIAEQETISGPTGTKADTIAGAYDLSETGPSTHTKGTWSCVSGGQPVTVTGGEVTVGMDQDVVCTIVNTAIWPHLTLVKIVDPEDAPDGPEDFTLTATPAAGGDAVIEGNGPSVGDDVMVGSYDLAESGPEGYDPDPAGWICIDADEQLVPVVTDRVTIDVAENITCTITNTAVPATVEVDKYWVINGGAPKAEGTEPDHLMLGAQLLVNDVEQNWSEPVGGFLRGAPIEVDEEVTIGNDLCRQTGASVVESNGAEADEPLPYDTTVMGGANHYTITNEVTCVSNLKLVKEVDPNGTGDETGPGAFLLSATPDGIDGQSPIGALGEVQADVQPGTYTLEEAGPSTYLPDERGWRCTSDLAPATVTDDQVEVEIGRMVECRIENEAIPSSWMVSKTSAPPSGATVMPNQPINYTVTLTKVGNGVPFEGITVIDTLTGVQDVWVSGYADDGATLSGGVLTWEVDELGDVPLTLTYTVTVGANAWNATIKNQVTPGPVPCVDTVDENDDVIDCDYTEHFTPHYTLDKSVALLADGGDGDDLAEPGEFLEYTLTIKNDTTKAVVDTVVEDDISDVLLDAELTSAEAPLTGPVEGILSWPVTDLLPGQTRSVSYVVQIDEGAWGVTLHNIATPDTTDGGECVGLPAELECETSTPTPEVTTMVVEKRDLESDDVLGGTTFQLWSLGPVPEDGCVFPAAPGAGATLVGTSSTAPADGQALFNDIQHGCYLLVETVPPTGYALPPNPVMGVQVDEENFVAGAEMSPIVVTNFAEGQLAIVAKRQLELIDGTWVESDGIVGFGDTVRYVVRVQATGPRNFHNIRVTDYVPGFNPEDTESTVQGTLVPDSAKCDEGLTCAVSVDDDNLVTWDIGDLKPDVGVTIGGTAVMDVVFPPLPAGLALDPGESFTASLWNVGFLDWQEAVPEASLRTVAGRGAGGGGGAGVATAATIELPLVDHHLVSNEVLVTATVTAPPQVLGSQVVKDAQLPQTGAPAGIGPLAILSGLMLALGAAMFRRHREE